MEVETKEQENSEEEQEEIKEPTSEAEAEENSEVSEKSEGESKEAAPKLDEEAKQAIIDAEYAKWQSKTLTPVTKERDTLRQQVTDLTAKLEDKQDASLADKEYGSVLDETGDEAEAKSRKEAAEEVNKRYRFVKENEKVVTEAAAHVKDIINELPEHVAKELGFGDKTPSGMAKATANAIRMTGITRRHQMAVERAYEILLPQDKSFQKQLGEIVTELEQAESLEHLERLAKLVLRERHGSDKPFHVDSGRNSGSGIAWSKLTREEKDKIITRELDKQKQEAGG